jgi:hypothetical protein
MRLDFGQTLLLLHLFDHPADRFSQGLAKHGPTGLADGRQACLSPFLRTVVPQTNRSGRSSSHTPAQLCARWLKLSALRYNVLF